jgi:hypothetical protein
MWESLHPHFKQLNFVDQSLGIAFLILLKQEFGFSQDIKPDKIWSPKWILNQHLRQLE